MLHIVRWCKDPVHYINKNTTEYYVFQGRNKMVWEELLYTKCKFFSENDKGRFFKKD